MRSDGGARPTGTQDGGRDHADQAGDLHRLRAAWRRQSLSAGWLAEDDWWTAAVDAVAQAACRDGSLRPACTQLGRARAQAGVGISEALTDVGALFRVLDQGTPPLDVITAVAEGWADAGLARLTGATCEDPLTGLVSFAYLRTRLREIYREYRQRGASPADTHRLVVVDLPKRPDPWRRISLVILVGHDLRAAFPGGDTLALDRPGRPSHWCRRPRISRSGSPACGGRSARPSAPRSACSNCQPSRRTPSASWTGWPTDAAGTGAPWRGRDPVPAARPMLRASRRGRGPQRTALGTKRAGIERAGQLGCARE